MKRNSLGIGLIVLSMAVMVSCREEKTATPTQTEVETSENPKTTTAKVNPAHGLPGHRCDLPVGAPLNSESEQGKQTQTKQNTTTRSSSVSPIRVDQTPDVNPPHGEPYHNCSIPVGAPLEG